MLLTVPEDLKIAQDTRLFSGEYSKESVNKIVAIVSSV